MNIYFATWLGDKSLGKSLSKNKANKRLVSFHFLIEQKVSKLHLKKYVRTGMVDLKNK